MNKLNIYSPEEIKNAVDNASAVVVARVLKEITRKKCYALLAQGIMWGEKVTGTILDGQQVKTRNIKRFDEPTL